MQSEHSAKVFGDKEDPRKRLDSIFGDADPSRTSLRTAEEWALGKLSDHAIDPARHPVAAVACLRKAEPRLTLRTATFLANALPQTAT